MLSYVCCWVGLDQNNYCRLISESFKLHKIRLSVVHIDNCPLNFVSPCTLHFTALHPYHRSQVFTYLGGGGGGGSNLLVEEYTCCVHKNIKFEIYCLFTSL